MSNKKFRVLEKPMNWQLAGKEILVNGKTYFYDFFIDASVGAYDKNGVNNCQQLFIPILWSEDAEKPMFISLPDELPNSFPGTGFISIERDIHIMSLIYASKDSYHTINDVQASENHVTISIDHVYWEQRLQSKVSMKAEDGFWKILEFMPVPASPTK